MYKNGYIISPICFSPNIDYTWVQTRLPSTIRPIVEGEKEEEDRDVTAHFREGHDVRETDD